MDLKEPGHFSKYWDTSPEAEGGYFSGRGKGTLLCKRKGDTSLLRRFASSLEKYPHTLALRSVPTPQL